MFFIFVLFVYMNVLVVCVDVVVCLLFFVCLFVVCEREIEFKSKSYS